MGARIGATLAWLVLTGLILAAGWLLLPACGIRLGMWQVSWCPHTAPVVAGESNSMLIAQIDQLEQSLLERAVCPPDPPPPPLQSPAPVTPRPRVGDVMQLPSDQADLSFLDGCWESSSELRNTRTGRPIQVKYCFSGGGGRGQVQISGGHSCAGSLSSRRDGDSLLITQGSVPCQDNSRFLPASITCRPSGATAKCDIIDEIDGRPEPRQNQVIGATFRRIE